MSNQTSSICQECQEAPEIKDWLFLAFHVVLVACLHWMAIDLTAKRQKLTQAVLTLHACAAGEVVLAASITVLLTHPAGIIVLSWLVKILCIKLQILNNRISLRTSKKSQGTA